jgi:hypothetical protein
MSYLNGGSEADITFINHGGNEQSDSVPASAERTPPRRGYSLWDEDRESTRYLAAETQHSIQYAKTIVNRVIREKFRALAPSYGVHVAVVAKWALDSLQLRARRDKRLAVILLAILLLFGIFLAFWPWAGLAVLIFGVIAAWSIVTLENMERDKRVGNYMLRGNFDPADAPEPSGQRDAERLAMISKRRSGNLVVFRGNTAFVGSGAMISKEHIVIDVSRGKDHQSGKQKSKPKKFTNNDVHQAISSAMRKIGLADTRVQERLFVNGRHIQDNIAILPDPKEPPNSSVDRTVLKQAALHPTPDARVYVCVEMPSWQGQLVVTLFARAVHTGGSLYIEWRFHVLRPVWKSFQTIDRHWVKSRRRIIIDCCRRSGIEVIPALLGALPRLWISHHEARKAQKTEARQRKAIEHGQIFNYGALQSIREDAGGVAAQHYFLGRDETMFVLLAQGKLIRAVAGFLGRKNVDTGQLDSQVKVIVEETNKYYSLHLGDVSNSNIAFGKNAQASGGGSSK